MLSLFAFVLATQVPIEQPPRLRTMLPNGALVLVEKVPNARSLTIGLYAAARGTEETSQTHGRRHLLEHLVALGPREDLDRRLEALGGFLVARTYRDSLAFEMTLPANAMKEGLAAVKEIVSERTFTPEAIAREADVIGQELAMRDRTSHASAEAWEETLAERGLDPLGSLEAIRATTPEALSDLRKRTFSAGNLAVVVMGNVDLDEATKVVADTLGLLPVVKATKGAAVPPVMPKPVVTVRGEGEYRGVMVPGFRSASTSAAIAAALALSTLLEDGQVVYTPSGRPGVVILGARQGTLAPLSTARAAEYFSLGRTLAARWVRTRLNEPSTAVSFRGMLLVQERDLRPELLLENLQMMPFAEFERAFRMFQSGEEPR